MVETPRIIFSIEKIPEELKQRRQWICWRYTKRVNKLVKLPLAPWASGHDGAVSVTDPNNCAVFNVAVEYAQKNGWGIGFVFFSGDGLTGIDLDHLDKLNEETQNIIKAANSYGEVSPSGKGYHIIVKGLVREAIKKESVEVYSKDRYFTVTGNHLDGSPFIINEAQQLLNRLESKYRKKTKIGGSTKTGGWEDYENGKGWILKEIREKDEKLNELLKGGSADCPSPSEADMSTLTKLLWWGYTENEAVDIVKRYRWRKKLGREDYIRNTLKKIDQSLTEGVREKTRKKNLFFSPPLHGGYISPKAETVEINKDALKPMSLTDVEEILNQTLKHDHENKLLVFLDMLMNYSGDDQQNILFNAPSSTGKSYIALEIAKFFPPEDVDKKGYTSPTAFFHVMGKMCTLDGEPLEDRHTYIEMKLADWEKLHPRPHAPGYSDKSREAVDARKKLAEWKQQKKTEYQRLKEEWNGIEKIYIVSLEKRILIFKDQPHDRVLQVLRSMLSHDEKILEVDITDKTKEGGHRTKKIRVVGFPTVVFCSATFSLNKQELTRFWVLSPDMSQDKIKESLKLQARRLSHKVAFEKRLTTNERRQLLMDRIRAIKNMEVNDIIIPEKLADDLLEWFTSGRDLSPRDMRDFPRLLELVKAHALFQMFQRNRTSDNAVITTEEDGEVAKQLLNNVIEANRLGLPPYVHKFYEERLKDAVTDSGITREEFNRLYFNMFRIRLGEKTRKKLIDLLSEAGLIQEKPDPNDKRRFKIYIPLGGVEKKQNISEVALSILVEMERETEIIEKTVFRKELETKLNLTTDTAEHLVNKLLRDGLIFSPRQDYLKKN